MNVTKTIRKIVQEQSQQLVFPGDYLHLGSPQAINTAFSRLADEGIIIRLGKGIYLHQVLDPVLGYLYPSLEKIAAAIAEREKVAIKPTGAFALNRLGLSTQVPTKVVYLTNGNARKIKIGNASITFKKTTPKKLAARSELTFLAIQALIELGEARINETIIDHLVTIMKAESRADILQDAKTAPVWVAKILHTIADKIEKSWSDSFDWTKTRENN